MSNCPKCNSFVREGQKFCTKCGANLSELLKPKIPPELAASIDIQEKKIAQDPLNPKLYIKLGDTYRDYKFYEEALVQYQKAVSIDESNAEAHLKSADVYFSLRRLDRAKDSYEKALKLQPESLEVKINLFSLLKELNLVSKAIELGKEIIKTEPKNLMVHKDLKEIFLQERMEAEAIQELKTIIALDPLEKEAYKQLAEIYVKKKETEKAFENYKMVLGLGAEDKDALFFVGHFLYEKGNYDEAIKYLEELLSLDPTNISTRIYLARSYLKKENLDKAIKTVDTIDTSYQKLNKLSKDKQVLLSDIFSTIGDKLLRTSDLEKSIVYFQKALDSFRTENAEKGLAKVYATKGDTVFTDKKYDDALEFYERALNLDKDNLEYKEKLFKVKSILTSKRRKSTAAIFVPLAVVSVLVVAFFVWRHFTTGQISINYSPKEVARIEIDGTVYSAGFIRLKKGEHEIVVKGVPGYADTNLVCDVPGGKKTILKLSLVPLYGSLKVNSKPSGADVYLDEKFMGNTPLSLNRILATSHRLTIKCPAYKKWDTLIYVSQNKVIDLGTVHLKNLAGLWKGKAIFNLENYTITLKIKQQDDSLFIEFLAKKKEGEMEPYYFASIIGKISANKFLGGGEMSLYDFNKYDNKWREFYGSCISLEGSISDDGNRIE